MDTVPHRSDQHAPPTPHRIPERVAEKAALSFVVDDNGCHVSTYSTGSHGYGQLGWDDDITGAHTGTTAHRAAWTHWNGPIPEGMTIDHLCKLHRCVRRDHLRMLSNFDNARRTAGRDWPLGQCINGHPDSELVHWGGKWKCRPCAREVQRRYRARKALARAA